MTQAISRPNYAVSLDLMQPAAVSASTSLSPSGNATETKAIAQDLLLYPGEPGEILLQISNMGDRPIRWRYEIEGNFPESTLIWTSWNGENNQEIAPDQKFDTTIYFQLPEEFFESQYALNTRQPALEINYQTEINVIVETDTEQQQIGYRAFNLCIRPYSSYLDYLPGLYREVDLMGRFLSIFEQAFDPTVQTIDNLWAYLDPLTAPEALLPFLANWVAWELDPRWSSDAQRRLIRNAVELYRWHGTRQGLRRYLHLYTGIPEERIDIREIFDQGFVLGPVQLGRDSMLGGGRPYHFIVDLHPEQPDQIDETLIREIIEKQKPAFSTYELTIRPSSGS